MKQGLSIFTLANFNLVNFNAALKRKFEHTAVNSVDYQQMFPYLLSLDKSVVHDKICICWITLEDLKQAKVLNIDLVDTLLKLNQSFQYGIVILPQIESSNQNSFQGNDWRLFIYQFNAELLRRSMGTNLFPLDPGPWLVEQGNNAISPAMWYLSKTPYHKQVFKLAAEACYSVLNAWNGLAKKVLIVDLDDTLWGGIVGDDGMDNLRIGGHDPIGEAFADVQKYILQLKSQGIILCISSKNDEQVALEVFDKNIGMILKKDDFVTWRINWKDKAENVAEIIKELNVGDDSVVFLDDSPAERNRIRTAFPGVLVPELPSDKMEVPRFLQNLNCFNRIHLTEEDLNRTGLYQDEQKRNQTIQKFKSSDDWIASLEIDIRFELLNEQNLIRAEQLLNKTNQMNLRTRKLNKIELLSWAQQKNHWFYVVHVKDIFGDNGITGLIGFHKESDIMILEDFVMSCRVMGRKIENTMLQFILSKTEEEKCKELLAEYLQSSKNKPILDFFLDLEIPKLHFIS